MKQVYVIVHDWCLKLQSTRKENILQMASVKLRLWWIKTMEEHYMVENEPREINPDLPPPNNQLEVLVCGAYTDACVSFQRDELDKRGYNAKIYYPASFP